MIDFNLAMEDLDVNFDYRGKLREKDSLTKLSNDLLSSFLEEIKRGKALPLQDLWEKIDD